MPGTLLFDVEWVGYLLAENLSDHGSSDFQQLPPWRTLVPVVTNEVANYTGQHLVATQSVLHPDYWRELRGGFDRYSLDVFDVVLPSTPTSWPTGSKPTRWSKGPADGG